MAKDRLTKSTHIDTTAREVDFVSRFSHNWQHLRDILGIMRLIEKQPGTVLKSKYAVMTLQSGAVGEGEEVPYSQAEVKEKDYATINLEKFKKGVSMEAINDHGYDDAVGMTDDKFLFELQSNVMNRFYAFMNGGTLTSAKSTFQAALAEAQGRVRNKWDAMEEGITEVVGWCNMMDAYDYLGAANITVQTEFGMNYIENFMGYRRLFLCNDNLIPSGFVVATPVENMILYYVNPESADFAKAGLDFTVDGETPLLGFHVEGNYSTVVSEALAVMGMTLMAEYLDGIAVVNFKGSIGSITAASAAGTTSGTKLTISVPSTIPADWKFYFAAKASTAYDAPSYLDPVPANFTQVTVVNGVADNVTATNGHKGRLIATNAVGQVVATSDSINVVA